MTSSAVEPADLLDLKLLPAWVKEPVEAKRYADVEGEHDYEGPARHRGVRRRAGEDAHRSKLDKSRAGVQRPSNESWSRHEVRRDRRAHRQQDRRNLRVEKPVLKFPGQFYPRSRSAFCHTLRHSKMLLRKSSPARSRIRCTLWRVCFLKSLNATRFGSQEKRNRRFISLATMAPCL